MLHFSIFGEFWSFLTLQPFSSSRFFMVIQCFPLPWFLIRRKVYCSLRMCKRLHFLWSNFLPLRHLGISYLVMRIFFSLHNLILLDSPALTWHDNFDFFFNHHHKKINGLGFENYWMIKNPSFSSFSKNPNQFSILKCCCNSNIFSYDWVRLVLVLFWQKKNHLKSL